MPGKKQERTSETKLHAPSEEFWGSVIHAGANVIDCGFCGRTHFVGLDSGLDFEDGELEELTEQNKQNPDKYIFHNEVSVPWGYLDGKQAVYGCPCNKASRYEDFIWNNRHIIEGYLSARAKKQLERAKKDSQLAEKVKEAVKTLNSKKTE